MINTTVSEKIQFQVSALLAQTLLSAWSDQTQSRYMHISISDLKVGDGSSLRAGSYTIYVFCK